MKKRFMAVLLSLFMVANCFGAKINAMTFETDILLRKDQDAKEFETTKEEDFVEDELIVVYEEEPLTKKELKEDGVCGQEILLDEREAGGAVSVVSIAEDVNLTDAMRDIEAEDGVDYVQKNYTYRLSEISTNDPYVNQQQYLNQTDIPRAWSEKSADTANVTVAVLDTGINYKLSERHEELLDVKNGGNVLYDYAYNAKTDTLFKDDGWDFDTYQDKVYCDYVGHGTEVASIISAQTNNEKGMAGVSYNARILPVNVFERPSRDRNEKNIIKIGDINYYPYTALAQTKSLITGYHYVLSLAEKLNIKVINLSIAGSAANDQALSEVIDEAYANGILTVAAAGNEGTADKMYPASLNHVISVGAVSTNDTWSTFSQHNSAIDLCAPGEKMIVAKAGVLSYYDNAQLKNAYYSNKQYAMCDGTSFSAPVVSAIAAMIYGINKDLSAAKVESILKDTSMDLGASGRDDYFGAGEVNGYYALKKAKGQTYSKDHKTAAVDVSKADMSLGKSTYVYSGKAVKPSVDVEYKDISLLSGTSSNGNVKLSYADGRTKVGTYKVTAKGIGGVTGTISKSFVINPVPTSIVSLTAKSKAFLVKWKKKSGQVTGYQVRYSTSKSMKNAKTKTIKSYKTVSTTVKSLKKKTYYYVQVRTYKTVKDKKYYSTWTSVKKIKTK
ncbi:MAG: S8 family serine peptidase [Lachnospiraceae bacterium]|nr:S8 family serine peptidase [Lachnospiraceae bacterium]